MQEREMNMKTFEISYPEDLPQAMGESPENFEREIQERMQERSKTSERCMQLV